MKNQEKELDMNKQSMKRQKRFGKKNGRILAFVLTLALFITLLTPLEQAEAASFNGYIAISSWEDLEDIVNDTSAKYYLTKDINMEGSGDWVPIENFTGILDGNGKTISNLHSTRGGLFASLNGEAGARAVVRNLTLKDVDLQPAIKIEKVGETSNIGAICNTAYEADIINCRVSGSIVFAEGDIKDGILSDMQSSFWTGGGLIGYGEKCAVKKCVNQTNIKGNLNTLGRNSYRYRGETTIYDYRDNLHYSIGGIIGNAVNVDLTECYHAGTVDMTLYCGYSYIGGIVGKMDGDSNLVQDCANTSDKMAMNGYPYLSEDSVKAYCGGLIGYATEGAKVKVTNAYSACSDFTTKKESFSYGKVTFTLGCVVGAANSSVQFDSVYYLKDAAAGINADIAGVGDKESASVKAFNTRGMKKQSNYKGWDFNKTWTINSDVNNGMPVLRCTASLFRLSKPAASEKSGTYRKGTKIELTAPAEGASIYYTTDGKTPTTKSTLYTGPITLDKEMKLRAIAVCDNFQASEVLKADYKLKASTEVMMSREKDTLPLDHMLKLKVLNLDTKKVSKQTWTANRKTIAKVSQDGLVTPVAVGSTTIKCTITYKDGTQKVVSCVVTVTE